MGNEFGCKAWAESCIILQDGTKYYVDNTKDDIENQMLSDEEYIKVELATLISDKIKRRDIQKKQVKEFYAKKV